MTHEQRVGAIPNQIRNICGQYLDLLGRYNKCRSAIYLFLDFVRPKMPGMYLAIIYSPVRRKNSGFHRYSQIRR